MDRLEVGDNVIIRDKIYTIERVTPKRAYVNSYTLERQPDDRGWCQLIGNSAFSPQHAEVATPEKIRHVEVMQMRRRVSQWFGEAWARVATEEELTTIIAIFNTLDARRKA